MTITTTAAAGVIAMKVYHETLASALTYGAFARSAARSAAMIASRDALGLTTGDSEPGTPSGDYAEGFRLATLGDDLPAVASSAMIIGYTVCAEAELGATDYLSNPNFHV